jgi:CheY-like chemotaxis protein
MTKVKVLLAEDDITMVSLLTTLLHQSGFDILDTIRNSEDTAGTRVVMSSGADVKEECMQHGANGFLLKPYMPDELITILKQTIKSA